jgi:uncharacterized RDD family membrane protein YckC
LTAKVVVAHDEHVVVESKYQTIWRRIWARCFDFVFLFPLLGFQFALADSQLSPRSKVGLTLLSILGGIAYHVVMRWQYGATLGEQAVGVRVVDISEKALTLRQALLREVYGVVESGYGTFLSMSALAAGKSLPGDDNINSWVSGVFIAIEFVTIFSNSKRRAPHDFIAGTVVVVEPAQVRVRI